MSLVLVIDDESTVRRMIRRALIKAGHDVLEAGDGRAGLQIAKKCSPEIVITDIVMPGIEGMETIREIRRLHPETKILAISGAVGLQASDYLLWAQRLGAEESLKKPFRVVELLATVDRLLAGRALSEPPA